MTSQSIRLRESAAPMVPRLRERVGAIEGAKKGDGTYRVRIITEGIGASADYSRELIESDGTVAVMDGLKSFFDHPERDWAPEERSVLSLAGRFIPGTVEQGETEEGLAAAYGAFKPRKEYAEFFEEFADTLGVSIYLAAAFSEKDDGTRKVEAFIPDPYNSIDIVVAAGRGGRFESARESLRTIESSLGAPRADKTIEASVDEEKEGNMLTKEDVQAIIAEALTPVVAAVAELKTAATEKATAEANAEATAEAVTEALTSYDEKIAAIAAEKDLLKSQRATLTESARKGDDITEALASAKATAAEAKEHFTAESAPADEEGFVFESERDSKTNDDAAFLEESAGYAKEA